MLSSWHNKMKRKQTASLSPRTQPHQVDGRAPPAIGTAESRGPFTSHEDYGCVRQPSCLFPSGTRSFSSDGSSSRRRNGRLPAGERLLIEEMNSLSIADRQKVYEEIHGVMDQPIQETEAMIDEALQKMNEHVGLLSSRKHDAYDRAAFLVPCRVQDRSFLLQFLRKERFDAAKAAQLLRNFMEFSNQLFGMNGILREPTLDDFDQDDLAALKTGMIYPLPGIKDRSGRPIVLYFTTLARFKHSENVIRSFFYVYRKLLKDEAAQTKGLVIVSWNYGDYVPSVPPKMFLLAASMWKSIPVHISACHTCFDQPSMVPVLELIRLTMGKSTRLRLRTHFGSQLESKYALLTYGIDPSKFPVKDYSEDDDTSIETGMHYAWIDRQHMDEEKDRATMIVPSVRDVLLGRGQPFRVFPGNQALAQLIEEHYNFYATAKESRAALFQHIADKFFRQQGRRLLKRESPTSPWTLASPQEAIKRIDASFRNKKIVDRYHFDRQLSD